MWEENARVGNVNLLYDLFIYLLIWEAGIEMLARTPRKGLKPSARNLIRLSHMCGRDSVTGINTTACQGLYRQAAGVRVKPRHCDVSRGCLPQWRPLGQMPARVPSPQVAALQASESNTTLRMTGALGYEKEPGRVQTSFSSVELWWGAVSRG